MKCPLGSAQRSAPPRPRPWRQTSWPLRTRARLGAAAEMHQPTPSMHRNRLRMGFAHQVAGGWDVCKNMGRVNSLVEINYQTNSPSTILHPRLHQIDYATQFEPHM
eukprot:3982844-Pyramimonas_sp.AAC.1